jgi:hypothetical protein
MKRRTIMRPVRTCAVPGCKAEIGRTSLLCLPHFTRTPRLIREAMMSARRDGRFRDWFAAGRQAADYHRDNPPAALAARIIGERDDPASIGA